MSTPRPDRSEIVFSHVLAFVCGACIPCVTWLGSRMLAPHYGVTLYLSTALLCVTLLALAAGFLTGGRLADLGAQPGRLRTPLLLAGVWSWAVGWMLVPMLSLCSPLGLRWSILVTSVAMFGPPLAGLATVIPVLLRGSSPPPERAGRTSGRLLAVFAAGGVSGAILCGYVLIPRMGVGPAWKGMAVSLFALGLLAGALGSRKSALSLILLPLALAVFWWYPQRLQGFVPEGTVLQEDSPYSQLVVAEEGTLRRLYLDGRLSGTVDVRDGQSFSPASPVLSIPTAFRTGAGRVLIIGLGDGSLASAYARWGWKVEAVELDPAVIRAAFGYFGLKPQQASVFQADGRAYLRLSTDTFDVIVLHEFPSGHIPSHLVSREAMALAVQRLAPDGMLLLQAPATGSKGTGLAAVAATLSESFSQVWMLPLSEAQEKPSMRVLLACRGVPEIQRPEAAGPYAQLVWSKRQGLLFAAQAITDLHNPVDLYWEGIHPAVRAAGL